MCTLREWLILKAEPWMDMDTGERPDYSSQFRSWDVVSALDGKWLMSVHSHKDVNGRYIRTPRLFEVDFSGDKLVVGKPYIP